MQSSKIVVTSIVLDKDAPPSWEFIVSARLSQCSLSTGSRGVSEPDRITILAKVFDLPEFAVMPKAPPPERDLGPSRWDSSPGYNDLLEPTWEVSAFILPMPTVGSVYFSSRLL